MTTTKTTEDKPRAVTLNESDRLYVIPESGGYSCLGFDVCERLTVHLARELAARGHSIPGPAAVGTLERYAQYRMFSELARRLTEKTGWKSTAHLTPELIGLESKRVEVRHRWDSGREETTRFIVGKSGGWIPCHLQISRRNAISGPAVCLGEILSVRTVGTR